MFFNQNKDKLKKHKSSFRIYIVSKGDNLYDLGHAFGIPYKVIKMANGLKSNLLKIKQKLIIPVRGDLKLAYKPRMDVFHTVKRGDTLGKISRKFGVKMSYLKKRNNKMKSTIIRIGEKIFVR